MERAQCFVLRPLPLSLINSTNSLDMLDASHRLKKVGRVYQPGKATDDDLKANNTCMHHVCNEHEWSDGQCSHGPLTPLEEGKEYPSKESKAVQATYVYERCHL